jgi:hypothetical protein
MSFYTRARSSLYYLSSRLSDFHRYLESNFVKRVEVLISNFIASRFRTREGKSFSGWSDLHESSTFETCQTFIPGRENADMHTTNTATKCNTPSVRY